MQLTLKLSEPLFDIMAAEAVTEDFRDLNGMEDNLHRKLNVEDTETDEQVEEKKRAYEDAKVYYVDLVGGRDEMTFEDFDTSYVTKRENGDFYVASVGYYRGSGTKFEMHLNEDFIMENAYVVGNYGHMYGKPMNKLTKLDREMMSAEEIVKSWKEEKAQSVASEEEVQDNSIDNHQKSTETEQEPPKDEAVIEENAVSDTETESNRRNLGTRMSFSILQLIN